MVFAACRAPGQNFNCARSNLYQNCFVRDMEATPGASLNWDHDHRIQDRLPMARLVHPTTDGTCHLARLFYRDHQSGTPRAGISCIRGIGYERYTILEAEWLDGSRLVPTPKMHSVRVHQSCRTPDSAGRPRTIDLDGLNEPKVAELLVRVGQLSPADSDAEAIAKVRR